MSDIFTIEELKTKEDRIKELVAQIYHNNLIARDAVKHAIKYAMDGIWRNPEFTPQEVLNVVGTRGYNLFKAAVIYQNALKATVPGYEIIEIDEEYVVNPDGTITHIVDSSSESSENYSSETSYSSDSSS